MTTLTRNAWQPLAAPTASPDLGWWLTILERALVSRAMDDLELTPGYKPQPENPAAGKLRFQFSAKGHEVPQLIAASLLDHPHDAATVYYRSRPFMLGIGLSPQTAFASNMHKLSGVSGGRDIGVVFNHKQPGGVSVLPASGDVGAQYTPAAGWAQAIRYRSEELGEAEWSRAVALCFGGDGSTATNGFWAALNIVTTLQLPMVMILEDNGYALTVPARYQTSGGQLLANLSNFQGVGLHSVDGADVVKLHAALAQAVGAARSSHQPQIVHVTVPRLTGHSWQDNQRYRPETELTADSQRDPLVALLSYVQQAGASEQDIAAMQQRAHDLVRVAAEQAWASPDPQASDALTHMFAPSSALAQSEAAASGERITMQKAIGICLADEMSRDRSILVFGEDVGKSGGVHRVTDGLQTRFGEGRVFDTSLSEEGIMGRSIGLTLAGLRPVPELQFRKYADPAHEQITDLGSLRWRTHGKFGGPVVLRIPVGYQKMGGDPWHAVTAEAVFAHLPGWQIAYPANAADAAGLLRTALRGDNPVIFLEHRFLYDGVEARRPYPGADYCLPFGQAKLVREGDAAVVVAWGDSLHRSLRAAEQVAASSGRQVAVLDLRTIVPWDRAAVLDAVSTRGRLLIVHEDTHTTGMGGQIAAEVARHAFSYLDAPIFRVSTEDTPIPCHDTLFAAVMPTMPKIVAALEELLAY